LDQYVFKIDGPIVSEGVPIHLAVNALSEFQSIVDKSYLSAVGSSRISSKDRERYFLKATEFQHGSFLTVFEIALHGVQLGLPLVGTLGPQNIWDYTKESFNLLKLVCSGVQKQQKPTYEFKDNGTVDVHVGDVIQNFNAPVINIAEGALPSYQNLAHLIADGKLNEISAGSNNSKKSDLYIGENDHDMFDVPTRLEKDQVEFRCEIFDFNKYKNSGKLSITRENQKLVPGEYNFSLFGNQDSQEYIFSMLEAQVEMTCLIEMQSNPFGEDKVYKLHITGVRS
jgi:hypothetical protein